MQRQRSFSVKPSRFLVLSFIISSSLLLLLFFSICLLRNNPSIAQETHIQLNTPSLIPDLSPIEVSGSMVFSGNFTGSEVENPFLLDAHFGESDDSTGNAVVSVNEKVESEENGFTVTNGRNCTEAEKGFLESEQEQYSKSENPSEKTEVLKDQRIEAKKNECDFTNGKWVFDENYPLYTNSSCPFIDEGFNCQANGRWDRDYMKWRWLPHECNIPRFDAVKMLKLIRGKRLVFVGDSINRNQWESMLCLLKVAVTDPKRVYETHGRRITKGKGYYSFKFVDYSCTVEYYVTHFLVHESKARVGRKRFQTLRIDTIDKGSSRWRGADILVFNTAHWWNHYKTKSGVNYYQEGDQVHPYLEASTAFRRALTTWATWVDKHINPRKTQVFFQSSVPSHFRGGQWNSGGHCGEAIQPLNDTSHVNYPQRNIIVEEVIQKMKTPVTFLNVTSLSEYRIDGHPSVYGRKPVNSNPSRVQDCSHWCLPGVPDIWNELLYFNLQSRQKGRAPLNK
ncbi:protein trichome birefringence-like 6 [Telopea speciosissima]|uniref:protein trichome birefringence-like 6 n=1 Tax=Telopea speciosissima TaxID=54955 RepID=UPI001CC55E76|nr:protein trichome birefringence-like 6 [Telopea speciosissima]